MLLGHAAMIASGFAWLSVSIGSSKAFAVGVLPFIAAPTGLLLLLQREGISLRKI